MEWVEAEGGDPLIPGHLPQSHESDVPDDLARTAEARPVTPGHDSTAGPPTVCQRIFYPVHALVRWFAHMRATFGIPFLVVITGVYFIQGVKSFVSLAANYYYKDELGIDPDEAQAALTTTLLPWSVKPLYGMMSDNIPIFGYNRRPYFLLLNGLGVAAWLLLLRGNSVTTTTALLFITNLATAFTDVVADGMVVERARREPAGGAGNLQSLCWLSVGTGGLLGAALGGYVLSFITPSMVFGISAAGPATIVVLTFLVDEPASRVKYSCDSAKTQVKATLRAFTLPSVIRPAVFIFLLNALVPRVTQIMFFFTTDVLHFDNEFLALLDTVGYAGLMVGAVLYNAFFKHVPFRTIIFWTQLLGFLISFGDIILVTRLNIRLGIPDRVFVLGSGVVADVLVQVALMPILVLAAKICPENVEATLFALLMSISNGSNFVASYWGAGFADLLGLRAGHLDNLWIVMVVRSVMSLLPIGLIWLLIPSQKAFTSKHEAPVDIDAGDLHEDGLDGVELQPADGHGR